MTQTINAQGMTSAQLALAFAGNPACVAAFYPPLVAPVAAALGVTLTSLSGSIVSGLGSLTVGLSQLSAGLGQLPVSGTLTASGGLQFSLSNGATMAVGGQVVPTLSFAQPTTLAAGSPATASATLTSQGSYTISLGIPQGAAGIGQQGAPGATLPAINSLGNFNPATNTSPTLSNGGQANGAPVAPGNGYYASAAGTLTLDGQTMVFAPGDAVGVAANQTWYYQAGAYGSGVIPTLTIPQSRRLYEDFYNDGATYVLDALGAVLESSSNGTVTNNGTFTVSVLDAGTYLNLPATTLPATIEATAALGVIGTSNRYNDSYPDGCDYTVDALGAVLMAFSPTGTVFPGTVTLNGTSSSSTFSAADFLAHETSNLAYRTGVLANTNTTAQAPVANYNLMLSDGQSKGMGETGAPHLTTTQPLDNVMIGQMPRCALLTAPTNQAYFTAHGSLTYGGIGDNAFHPLVAGTQDKNGNNAPDKIGVLSNVGSVTVTVSGGQGTFIAPGTNFPLDFSANDSFQFAGFAVATGNNAQTTNAHTFTCVSSAMGTLVVAEGGQCQATTAPESGITFAQVGFSNWGETSEVTALNAWRQANLNQKQLYRDPSRIFVSANANVSGQNIAALSPGAALPLWERCTSAASLTVSNAGTGTSVICAFLWNQGGGDAGTTETAAQYTAAFGSLVTSVNTTIATGIFGQARPPFVFTQVVDGPQLVDTPDTNGVYCPITTAQAQIAGCRPIAAAGSLTPGAGITPITPDVYMVGPDYAFPDHGGHLTANGYRWLGAMQGKVYHKVIDQGLAWKPMHCIGLTYRGNQIIVDLYVPVPPVALQDIMNYTGLVSFADAGFTVTDATGVGRTITGVSVPPNTSTQIALAFSGAALTAPPRVTYADAGTNGSNHNGAGNVRDSDPTVALVTYQYLGDGNGQELTENITLAVGPTQPVSNGSVFPLWNWLVPFNELATAG